VTVHVLPVNAPYELTFDFCSFTRLVYPHASLNASNKKSPSIIRVQLMHRIFVLAVLMVVALPGLVHRNLLSKSLLQDEEQRRDE